MIEGIIPTRAAYTGYFNEPIQRILDAGKIIPERENENIKKTLDENRKKVQPVYNSKGKLIEYEKYGKHLDVLA